jgi:formylglycine-generating enzyme required for sulfatase activity
VCGEACGSCTSNETCQSGICKEKEVDCLCGEPGCGTCPTTIVDISGGNYTITSTEISRDQYAGFVAFSHDMGVQVSECAGNTSYLPGSSWPIGGGQGSLPVVGVDYCDARAYCAWTGRSLCGDYDGNVHSDGDHDNAGVSIWYDACSGGQTLVYPYGGTYEPQTCNGGDYVPSGLTDVGSVTTCEGSLTDLYDMSGNVWEWTNGCSATQCLRRGGSRFSTPTVLECDLKSLRDFDYSDSSTGIRCCTAP